MKLGDPPPVLDLFELGLAGSLSTETPGEASKVALGDASDLDST